MTVFISFWAYVSRFPAVLLPTTLSYLILLLEACAWSRVPFSFPPCINTLLSSWASNPIYRIPFARYASPVIHKVISPFSSRYRYPSILLSRLPFTIPIQICPIIDSSEIPRPHIAHQIVITSLVYFHHQQPSTKNIALSHHHPLTPFALLSCTSTLLNHTVVWLVLIMYVNLQCIWIQLSYTFCYRHYCIRIQVSVALIVFLNFSSTLKTLTPPT